MIRTSVFLDWFALHASQQFILMGDFNCNWFDCTIPRNKIFNWCLDNDAKQIISTATRIVPGSSTLLDLCITRVKKMNSSHRVLDIPFSDHKGLSFQFGRQNYKPVVKTIQCWNFGPDLVDHARLHPPNFDALTHCDVESMSVLITNWLKSYEDQAKSSRTIRDDPLKNNP